MLADIVVDESSLYGRHAFGRFPEQISVWDLFDGCDGYVGHHRCEREPLDDVDLSILSDYYLDDEYGRSMSDFLYN